MLENRSLKSDLVAVALLVAVIFLAVSLATFDPADPPVELAAPLGRLYQPDLQVYPPNSAVTNACGQWGAITADLLLRSLGVAAYYLVLSLAVLDSVLLRRRKIDTPLVRAVGWLLSLLGFATVAAIVGPGLLPGPAIGPGGYLGTLCRGLLELHFATAGGLMLAISLVVAGLLLSTDYALIRFAGGVLNLISGRAFRHAGWLSFGRKTTNAVAAADATVETDADGLKVRRKRGAATAPTAGSEAVAAGETTLKRTDVDGPAVAEKAAAVSAKSANSAKSAKSAKAAAKIDESVEEPDAELATPAEAESAEDEEGTVRIRRLQKSEREEVIAKLNEASRTEEAIDYKLPDIDLLLPSDDFNFDDQEKEVRRKAKILEKTFADFGFKVKVVEIETGPVIAQYEVELEAGLRLSKITALADDLAIALRVPSVRIVAPIPGKNTVGIEVPNEQRQVVRLREVIEEGVAKTKKMRIPLFLGKDVSGNPLIVDLSTLPHLLIAGRTGTGKSVCLNAIISSILMTRRPDEVRMLMIDPKMVELSGYGRLPHLMHPVVTDMRKAEAILAWAVEKMEERYALLARAGVRHISNYNQLGEEELMERLQPENDEERASIPLTLPFIVIVADEIADMMMTAGKEVEQHIIRLAQKSRAVGIHLILATQKPTVDVITGLIKSNLPARIAFQVASRTDSRVVLDEMGADKLLGNGDLLFLWPGTSTLLRGQGTYLNDDEIEKIVDVVSTGEPNFVHELVNLKVEEEEGAEVGPLKKRDDLYESAVDLVVREGRGSVSLLQRALGIGYGRAARLIDWMAEDGIVGTYAGSQAREVMLSVADWEKMQGGGTGEPDDFAADSSVDSPRRSAKIRPHGDTAARRPAVAIGPAPFESDGEDDFDEQFDEDEVAEYETV